MSDPKYNFQFVQKLVLFSDDWSTVLLARRYGEADYDGVFSFVGGKMEASDESIIASLSREKTEEVGPNLQVAVYPLASNNLLFRKSDGNNMIIMHYLARCTSGDAALNKDEYSEYRWVPIDDLGTLEPIIPNIPSMVKWALQLKAIVAPADYVQI
jgi:NADH pyrophosphatase NudC (nudix superfamily)